jgi:ferric-dicitrate binding protein FerR (iron transport regulator)
MKHRTGVIVPAVVVLVLLAATSPGFAQEPELVEMEGREAEVALIEGSAELSRKEPDLKQLVNQGDLLVNGDHVATGEQARLELAMPDGSFLRFAQKTAFELVSVDYDEQTKQRDIEVHAALGKTWAKVSNLVGEGGRFQVTSKNAVAGIRGTTYRMNVNSDTSVVVKVYDGTVQVSSPPKTAEKPGGVSKPGGVEAPHPVSGPHPVAGPHPVTMEEWTYIVRAMQQIVIYPDGTVSKPFRFDPAVDMDDWVRWNQSRDELQP